MKITASLCAVTVAAVMAAANIENTDRRGDEATAALAASEAEAGALLAQVDLLAAGGMTPAERRAFTRELEERGRRAHEALRDREAAQGAP
ncbi:hypothetical protein [Silanimonas sp.]|jgi:hypothetical protein|uniref:hypothetical protein n=1 Tax=Silanimonas sp. TaxID=1929290 RepID=UPI0022C11592|nr:hypothetical protein [Silanimonas sp.]MCZ8063987.1 hypothetical protein [Silanimonas sp.]